MRATACIVLGVLIAAVLWFAARAIGDADAREPARAVAAQSPSSARADLAHEVLLLRFRAESVDGVDELVIKDGEASIEHLEWDPMKGVSIEVLGAPPDSDALSFAVRAHTGRPRVSVVQRPSAANEHTLRVRIDDGPNAGAAPLAFELWAVPMKPTPHPFDVVLITIDSLRPDHLGSYGCARATSPNLDAFASSALRCANAFSTSSFTPPSHASLMTSRYVGDHGLLTWNALPGAELTLAEVLAAHGYRTGACVNLGLLSQQNLGQGFEWRREGSRDTRDAREVVSEGLEFLRAADDRPFFLWLHLYDVHRPYGRIRGWTDRFASTPRAHVGDREEHYNLQASDVREQGFSAADLAYIADRYDAGIAYADAQLGPLLAELSSPARTAHTLIVITADHGESLLEHPERVFTHDPYLFASVTRVPLLVRFPDAFGKGTVRSEPVGLIDVAPTVCATLGIEPPPTFAGRSLRDAPSADREMYSECWGWERLAALRTKDFLVLRDAKAKKTQVFALADDPGEQHPLAPDARPDAITLVKKLDAFVARRPVDESGPPLDPELVRRLRSLGYTDK